MGFFEVGQDLCELLRCVMAATRLSALDIFTNEASDLANAPLGLKQRLATYRSGELGQVLMLGDGVHLIPGEPTEIETFLKREHQLLLSRLRA